MCVYVVVDERPHVPHGSAHHPLMKRIPINYLSRWLGHSSIQTTLIYLELIPPRSYGMQILIKFSTPALRQKYARSMFRYGATDAASMLG